MCCLSRDKESYILNNELVIFRSFRNVMITVKYGDIQKESGEGVGNKIIEFSMHLSQSRPYSNFSFCDKSHNR